jgi:ribosomal protein S18 acetylase RimI-like enzyme
MNAAISITAMTPGDYEDVVALWRATEHMGQAETREEIDSFLARNPELSPVARAGGRLIGAVLCGHDGRRGYLAHLAVAQDFRKQGVARALVDYCLERLRSIGISRATIHLYVDNQAGERYWQRTGWRERTDLKVYSFDL